jgi:hypothetical protein
MAIQKLNLTRDQLSSFLQNFEQIKQFENLFSTVDAIGITAADANYVYAGPPSGAAAQPAFRPLVVADIPALPYVGTVTAVAPITSTGGLNPVIGVTASALTRTNDTNVLLTLGGSPATSLLAPTSITVSWTGLLAINRGGTNSNATPTAGGITYGNGTAYAFSAVGTSGQVLTSSGAGAPTWTTPTVGTVTSVAALTLGTAGTDLTSTVANPTTTPVITLNVPTASATNRGALSAADWRSFTSNKVLTWLSM